MKGEEISLKKLNRYIKTVSFDFQSRYHFLLPFSAWGGGGGGATLSHNKWGWCYFDLKRSTQNPGTYLKLRPKNREPETLDISSK